MESIYFNRVARTVSLLAVLFLFSSAVAAQSITAFGVDWQENQGAVSDWSVNGEESVEGSESLEVSSSGTNLKSENIQASFADNNVFYWYVKASDGGENNHLVVQLESSNQNIQLRTNFGQFQLRTSDGNAARAHNVQSNHWYKVEIETLPGQDKVEGRVYDESDNLVYDDSVSSATLDSEIQRVIVGTGADGTYAPTQQRNFDLYPLVNNYFNQPLIIETVSTSPREWSNTEPIDLTANITDSGAINSVSATVYEGGVMETTQMLSQDVNGNWTVEGLFKPDKDTEYKISLNATDNSGVSTVQNVTSKTAENVSLEWSHSKSSDGFNIYSDVSGSMSLLAQAASKSFEHVSTDLDSGEEVCYEVTAFNNYGESEPSSEKCTTIP